MPKIKLNEAWMFAGVTYLAGDHTVDDDLARIFEARGAFAPQPAAGEPAELAPNTPPGAPQAPAAPQGTQTGGDQLESLVGAKAASALRSAGYGTAEAWRQADDATLLALDGVGNATIQKLREQG